MTFINAQTFNSVFDTSLSSNESILLFKETTSFSVPRGIGVWRDPIAGGTYSSDGGQFVFISGRPDRYDSDLLRSNVEYILENFFNESTIAGDISRNSVVINNYRLEQNYPNPFNPITTIQYELPQRSDVQINIYDLLGREVTTLVSEMQNAGYKSVKWNATNDRGQPVSAGVYFYQIRVYYPDGIGTGNYTQTRKMVLLKQDSGNHWNTDFTHGCNLTYC